MKYYRSHFNKKYIAKNVPKEKAIEDAVHKFAQESFPKLLDKLSEKAQKEFLGLLLIIVSHNESKRNTDAVVKQFAPGGVFHDKKDGFDQNEFTELEILICKKSMSKSGSEKFLSNEMLASFFLIWSYSQDFEDKIVKHKEEDQRPMHIQVL